MKAENSAWKQRWLATDADCLDEGEGQYVEETLVGAMVDDRTQMVVECLLAKLWRVCRWNIRTRNDEWNGSRGKRMEVSPSMRMGQGGCRL